MGKAGGRGRRTGTNPAAAAAGARPTSNQDRIISLEDHPTDRPASRRLDRCVSGMDGTVDACVRACRDYIGICPCMLAQYLSTSRCTTIELSPSDTRSCLSVSHANRYAEQCCSVDSSPTSTHTSSRPLNHWDHVLGRLKRCRLSTFLLTDTFLRRLISKSTNFLVDAAS